MQKEGKRQLGRSLGTISVGKYVLQENIGKISFLASLFCNLLVRRIYEREYTFHS